MSRRLPTPVLLATVAVFLVGLAIHGIVRVGYRDAPMSTALISDSLAYDQLARELATGGMEDAGVFHQAPLFPLLLSDIRRTDSSRGVPSGLLTAQMVFTSIAIALLVPLGFLGFGSLRAGILAGAVGLFHGPFVYHSLKLLPVSLALATQATALLFLVLAGSDDRKKPRTVAALFAGLFAGLAALARAEIVLFILIATIWLAMRSRSVRMVAAFLIGAALLVLPATVHNVRQGDAVLIASAGGENLFIGNQRGADGWHTPLSPSAPDLFSQRLEAKRIAEAASGETLRPSQVSSYWTGRAVSEVTADPGGWLKLLGRKLLLMADPGDPADMYSLALERSLYLPGLYLLILPAGFVLAAGGIGVAAALRSKQAIPLLLFVGFHITVLLLFFVSTRLRIPLYLGLALFAGYGLDHVAAGWKRKDRRTGVVLAVALILGFTIAGFSREQPSDRERVRLAAVLSMEGALDDGLEVLAPALNQDPPNPVVEDQAGWLLQKKRDWSGAEARYRRALEGIPDDPRQVQTRSRLARVLEMQGRLNEAAAEHDRAVASPYVQPGTYREREMFRQRIR